MNIVKMIAVSAVVAIVLSLMGKQIGSITYNVLHPSDDPVEHTRFLVILRSWAEPTANSKLVLAFEHLLTL